MILSTQQQAQNFVLFALENSEMYDDLTDEGTREWLEKDVENVFGSQTFSHNEMQEILDYGIAAYEQNY